MTDAPLRLHGLSARVRLPADDQRAHGSHGGGFGWRVGERASVAAQSWAQRCDKRQRCGFASRVRLHQVPMALPRQQRVARHANVQHLCAERKAGKGVRECVCA
jgi:hypothetical protein